MMNINVLTAMLLIVSLLLTGSSSANTIKDSDVNDIIKVMPAEYAKYKKQTTGKNDINDCNETLALLSEAKAMLDKPAKERVYKNEDYAKAYFSTWHLCWRVKQNSKDPAVQKRILEEWNNSLIKDDNATAYQICTIAYNYRDRSFLTDKFWELLRQTNKKKTISAISLVLYQYGNSEDINKLKEKRDAVTDPKLKQIIQNAINWRNYRLSDDKTNPGPAEAPPRMDMNDM